MEALDARIGELQAELGEILEHAIEMSAYEAEEGESLGVAAVRDIVKTYLEDLNTATGESVDKERVALLEILDSIKNQENQLKKLRRSLKELKIDLELKLLLKRLGKEGFVQEKTVLIEQVDLRIAELNPEDKKDKKKISALQKDRTTLENHIARTDELFVAAKGQLTLEEIKRLVLKKLYDMISKELERYLQAEKRELLQVLEKLWDKYAVSQKELEEERDRTLMELNQHLQGLGYLG